MILEVLTGKVSGVFQEVTRRIQRYLDTQFFYQGLGELGHQLLCQGTALYFPKVHPLFPP